jgi:hypothetical protein
LEAKRQAIACYLSYRRDGGENHDAPGVLISDLTQALRASGSAAAASMLQHVAAPPETSGFHAFIRALQAVVAGSRDRALADAPELDWMMAAEILFLIEMLERAQR